MAERLQSLCNVSISDKVKSGLKAEAARVGMNYPDWVRFVLWLHGTELGQSQKRRKPAADWIKLSRE